ncbi:MULTISPECIES: DUF2797 domain-containing protein [unclassified Ketobacter]|jgi:hypothetical protein|uniref:DUF2797 domain-containing protein n=1 Tax=unclassified Ketobacter TaxID=2639109 RepID=UPI0025C522FA|nr:MULTISPECIES: DUF2797 domain-containing protein [unclassified Ketobacter]MCK5792212.1 DUF2797 domain-containing protein [Ketobacter sp.]|tara:strand:- start:11421 stop:12251 length:831 start_codon:yes stop_codon:yes gene_type:complete
MHSTQLVGTLAKMKTALGDQVEYRLPVGDERLDLNPFLGKPIKLTFTEQIFCTHCGRKTKKSFDQGYCYPCFRSLAQCDTCIIKPEQCHFEEGTCREPDWARNFCFQGHTVYLANSSGIKVGITRNDQVPTRWIDQGAIQALPVFQVQNRFHSGLVEITLGKYVADKTRWQAMLKNQVTELDMIAERDKLLQQCQLELDALQDQLGEHAVVAMTDAQPVNITYPVLEYPSKVVSLNFDKTPEVAGTLLGIKGQYLLLDSGVINIRKFTGYQVEVAV